MILWLFIVLIISSSYTTSLSSILTAQQLTSHIVGIDSLKSSSDPIGVPDRSFVYDYLINDLNIAESRVRILKTQREYDETLYRGPKGGGVAAIVDELPYVKILLSRTNCKFKTFKIVGEGSKRSGWGFAFQRNSPLAIDLSERIRQLSKNGDLENIHDKWFGRNHCAFQDEQANNNKLPFMSFWGLFLLCGIVCFLSLLVHLFGGVFRQYVDNSPKKDEEIVTEIKEAVELEIIDNKQQASESSSGH